MNPSSPGDLPPAEDQSEQRGASGRLSSISFSSLGLGAPLAEAVLSLGFERPTPIQAEAIPALLSGSDLVGQSKTGSGKTAAFGLPVLERVRLEERAVQALILCPTRELAAQVARELRSFGTRLSGLRIVELVGGQPARPQRETLARGAHVAVGTPGRVADHLGAGALDPTGIGMLVLDEADRMLDMGFGPDVRRIIKGLPVMRQTALFSATFPEAIEEMSRSIQRRGAVRVAGEAEVESGAESLSIRHLRIVAPNHERLHALAEVLTRFPHETAIVFCNFKASVAEVTERLRYSGVSADRLDGDLDQFH
ncbi:MAG: DEAD/DEAH box helicase, partial [Planctomycetota bacterium]